MVLCLFNFVQQVPELICAVCVYLDIAAVKQRRLIGIVQKGYKGLKLFWNSAFILGKDSFRGSFHNPFVGPSGDDPLFTVILTKEKVKEESYSGCQQ